jgi:hypothetical protein
MLTTAFSAQNMPTLDPTLREQRIRQLQRRVRDLERSTFLIHEHLDSIHALMTQMGRCNNITNEGMKLLCQRMTAMEDYATMPVVGLRVLRRSERLKAK